MIGPAECKSLCDYLDWADWVRLPGLTVCVAAEDNWAEAVKHGSGFHGLIGVMFSRAWSRSSPCSCLCGARPMVGAGRVEQEYQARREMICSPRLLPLGVLIVTHGTLVMRSVLLLWHHGGSRPYYQERGHS